MSSCHSSYLFSTSKRLVWFGYAFVGHIDIFIMVSVLTTTDHPYPNSFIPQALNFGSMIRKVVQFDFVHLNPNISCQFNYMENLGELVQFELTSHFNKLSFCPIFRSQMHLEPCLAWHNFFCTLSTGMQLQLLPNSLKHMKKALQRKPNYEKVQLSKRLHHIVQHLNPEMSISKVH